MNKKPCVFAILGAGSWGTAVGLHLATAGHRVLLWGRSEKQIKHMQIARENARYLPGQNLPELIEPTVDLNLCLTEADEICLAVPSHAFAELCSQLLPPPQGFFWITKGLDPETNLPFSELVAAKFGKNYPCAVLSGPSFAKEVAKGLPTALTLASNQKAYQQRLLNHFHGDAMRVYLSQDLLGVQLCGAIKNVLAIACGISDGLQFGANAKAALITRGLAEMKRLGLVMGGLEQTFVGLAGLGDLVLTCTDNQSRNRRFGLELGLGRDCQQAIASIGQVVEGYHNAAQVLFLAKRHQVDMPICEAVYQVLHGERTAQEAALQLMRRAPSSQACNRVA
jgi:glycerol-3-phosphate dehydrogenase (NAD(P)+)